MQDGDGVSWPGNISALDTSSPPLLQPSSSPLLSLASQHHPLDSNLLFIYFSPLQALFYLLFILDLVYSFTWKSIYIYVCVYIGLDLFLLPLLLELRLFSLPPRLNLFVLLVYSLFVVSFRRLGKVYVHICVDLFLLLLLYVFCPSPL